MKTLIRGEFLQLEEDAILSAVPPDTLARLRAETPRPVLRAYRVAHEGTASGNLVGAGLRVARVVKSAVIQLFDVLPFGVKAFKGHGATNEHTGRAVIGEIVGKALRMVDGALSALAVVALKPEYEREALDVASLESEIEFQEKSGNEIDLLTYRNITGLALGDSRVQSPGFPGATLLGAVQAFIDGESRGKAGGIMTLEELKAAIQEGKHKPSDLFGEEALKNDPLIVKVIRAEKQTEYEHAKRVEGRLAEARQEVESLKAAHANELAQAKASAVNGVLKARDSVATFCAERKLTAPQLAWVNRNLARLEPQATDEAALKTELNKWLDGQLSDYEEAAKIINPGSVTPKPGDNGAPPSDATPGSDLTDPKVNDLIPQ